MGLHCDYRCNPSLGIVRFSEGVIELILRSVVTLFAIAAMVPSALIFALGEESLHEVIDRMELAIQTFESERIDPPDSLREFVDEGNAGTLAAGGVVFGIAMLAFTYHTTVILVRFHVTCINDFLNSFLLTDIVTNLFFAVGYFAGGVVAAVYAEDLGELLDPFGMGDEFQARKTRDALAATAAFAIFNAVLCLIHAFWMILFRAFRWNEKLEAKA